MPLITDDPLLAAVHDALLADGLAAFLLRPEEVLALSRKVAADPAVRAALRPPVLRLTSPVTGARQATSRRAANRVLPKTGTQRARVLGLLHACLRNGETGATDDQIEGWLSIPHQSASATRNGLVRDGWVRNSGLTRPNRYGNDAIVWEACP